MTEIKIRDAEIDDAANILKIYAYYVENTAITFELQVPTLENFRLRIKKTLEEKYPYIVAEIDNKIVGYAYAGSFVGREAYKYSAELTIYLDKDFCGHGIGKKLYFELERRLKVMGIRNLYACIGYPEVEDEFLTLASVKFHERQGFNICGKFNGCGFKFNRWYSMVWMEKIVDKRGFIDVED
ncbi:MAG: N-acetyltransferase [Selenomonadaceae bacterium]|nr:N-acetyltransferase [Selenomonadaceae bacterium]